MSDSREEKLIYRVGVDESDLDGITSSVATAAARGVAQGTAQATRSGATSQRQTAAPSAQSAVARNPSVVSAEMQSFRQSVGMFTRAVNRFGSTGIGGAGGGGGGGGAGAAGGGSGFNYTANLMSRMYRNLFQQTVQNLQSPQSAGGGRGRGSATRRGPTTLAGQLRGLLGGNIHAGPNSVIGQAIRSFGFGGAASHGVGRFAAYTMGNLPKWGQMGGLFRRAMAPGSGVMQRGARGIIGRAAMRGVGGMVAGNLGAAMMGMGPSGIAGVAVIGAVKAIEMFAGAMNGLVAKFGKWAPQTAAAQAQYEAKSLVFDIKMAQALDPLMKLWVDFKSECLDFFTKVLEWMKIFEGKNELPAGFGFGFGGPWNPQIPPFQQRGSAGRGRPQDRPGVAPPQRNTDIPIHAQPPFGSDGPGMLGYLANPANDFSLNPWDDAVRIQEEKHAQKTREYYEWEAEMRKRGDKAIQQRKRREQEEQNGPISLMVPTSIGGIGQASAELYSIVTGAGMIADKTSAFNKNASRVQGNIFDHRGGESDSPWSASAATGYGVSWGAPPNAQSIGWNYMKRHRVQAAQSRDDGGEDTSLGSMALNLMDAMRSYASPWGISKAKMLSKMPIEQQIALLLPDGIAGATKDARRQTVKPPPGPQMTDVQWGEIIQNVNMDLKVSLAHREAIDQMLNQVRSKLLGHLEDTKNETALMSGILDAGLSVGFW